MPGLESLVGWVQDKSRNLDLKNPPPKALVQTYHGFGRGECGVEAYKLMLNNLLLYCHSSIDIGSKVSVS